MGRVTNVDVHVFETRDGCFSARLSWTKDGRQKHWNAEKNNDSIEHLLVDIYDALSSIIPSGLAHGRSLEIVFVDRDQIDKESMN